MLLGRVRGGGDIRGGLELEDEHRFVRKQEIGRAKAVDELGQTIVMVSHDPVAAAYADRVVFLVYGRIVHERQYPTAEQLIDQM